MLSEHSFARDEVLPSWFANAVGAFLSVAASDFVLTNTSTVVTCTAGTGQAAAAIAINGNWRWVEAPVTRAHPGGSAGVYDIYATAAANNIVSTPAPFTDATNRAFALAILPHGSTPTIVAGTVDQFRLVGTCTWDGSRITSVTQTVGRPTAPTNEAPFPGDFKFSAQAADHGVNPQGGGAAWLLIGAARSVSPVTYPGLYAAMGSPALDGGGNFALPTPAGRVFGAAGAGAGLTSRAAGALVSNEEVHTLANGEMPAHSHGGITGNENQAHNHGFSGTTGADDRPHVHTTYSYGREDFFHGTVSNVAVQGWGVTPLAGFASDGPNTGHLHAYSGTTATEGQPHNHNIGVDGGGGAHNNMQPTYFSNTFIKT